MDTATYDYDRTTVSDQLPADWDNFNRAPSKTSLRTQATILFTAAALMYAHYIVQMFATEFPVALQVVGASGGIVFAVQILVLMFRWSRIGPKGRYFAQLGVEDVRFYVAFVLAALTLAVAYVAEHLGAGSTGSLDMSDVGFLAVYPFLVTIGGFLVISLGNLRDKLDTDVEP